MIFSPATFDLTIFQGATFRLTLTLNTQSTGVAFDLTGYTARMQARASIDSDATYINLTTENGGITIDGSTGAITLFLSDTQTSQITQINGVYDLELISGSGDVSRLSMGNVTLSREVTR